MSDRRLKRLDLEEDPHTTSILKALRKAEVQNIPYNSEEESIVCSATLDDVEFDADSAMPSTIYIRKFYPTLLYHLLKHKYTILTGYPGIYFQHWYILYCMFNANEELKIAKQQLVFIFLEYCKASFYTTDMNLAFGL